MGMRVRIMAAVLVTVVASGAWGELRAGVGAASINPMEAGLKTQLGGYGERLGEPAHGTHDTIMAKALLLEDGGKRAAIVSLDVCSVPIGLLQLSLAKANIEGLNIDNVLMPASHSHAGIEGFSLDSRNVFGNARIGIFDQQVLDFVVERVAQAMREAADNLSPARVGSGSVELPGFTANRRDDPHTDDELVALRVDDEDGKPMAVVVNFTAHGTIMTEKEMLVSGCWSGNMQRTVEAALGNGALCLYMNGAEGDIRPNGARGGSRWEMAEDYGRRVGLAAARLAEEIKPRPLERFEIGVTMVNLPPRVPSPDFLQIAGAEYGVTQEMLGAMLQPLFPNEARLYSLRLGDWQAVSFPGEAICEYGLGVKSALREQGVKHPCISGLTSEYIGYILTEEEYQQSGYEATASFYGPGLGALLYEAALAIGKEVATR